MGPLLCSVWQRIEAEMAPSPEGIRAVSEIKNILACKGE
jgi:hypothetical protein